MKTQTLLRNTGRTILTPEIGCLIMSIIFAFAAGVAHGQITDALKIKIARGSYSDEAVIRFVQGGTNGFDGSYEAWKLFSSNAAVPNIFTKDSLGDQLAINALAPFNESVTVDVYLKIGTAGTYSISSTVLGAFAPGTRMMLKDLATNQSYDLRTGNIYTFSLPLIATSAAARFRVIFSYPAYVEVEPVTCTNCTDGTASVVKSGETVWNYSVSNSAGANVRSGSATGSITTLSGLAADNYTVVITNDFTCAEAKTFSIEVEPVTLGASFIDFDADRKGGDVAIQWTTGMESNTDFFYVERSADGLEFESISQVNAAGNSSDERRYSSLDRNPNSGASYYRIKLFDNNGSISYSEITSVNTAATGILSVFPIPAFEQLNVCIEGNKNAEVLITIRDMAGRAVLSEKVVPDSDRAVYPIPVTAQFISGVYMVTAVGNGKVFEQKIIIH